MAQPGGVLMEFNGKRPKIDPTAYIAPTAVLIGDVTIGPNASIWFGAVLRGDEAPIVIGSGANLQDNCVVHVGAGGGAFIESLATIGHSAIVHNCTVRQGALVGMGAVLLDYAEVGPESLVAAGAVVPEHMIIGARRVVKGVPAKDTGPLTERALYFITASAPSYLELSKEFKRDARILSSEECRG